MTYFIFFPFAHKSTRKIIITTIFNDETVEFDFSLSFFCCLYNLFIPFWDSAIHDKYSSNNATGIYYNSESIYATMARYLAFSLCFSEFQIKIFLRLLYIQSLELILKLLQNLILHTKLDNLEAVNYIYSLRLILKNLPQRISSLLLASCLLLVVWFMIVIFHLFLFRVTWVFQHILYKSFRTTSPFFSIHSVLIPYTHLSLHFYPILHMSKSLKFIFLSSSFKKCNLHQYFFRSSIYPLVSNNILFKLLVLLYF